jgi:hypothetical protein
LTTHPPRGFAKLRISPPKFPKPKTTFLPAFRIFTVEDTAEALQIAWRITCFVLRLKARRIEPILTMDAGQSGKKEP